MSDVQSPLARALGRIPCGLYVVATSTAEGPAGFVGSFVMQVGFDPPTVMVATGKSRGPLEAIRTSRHFALSILDDRSRDVMGAFFQKHDPGQGPFDALATAAAPAGSPVLTDALAWLECELSGEHDCGDHIALFGRVTAAAVQREGDPAIHLRADGLGY